MTTARFARALPVLLLALGLATASLACGEDDPDPCAGAIVQYDANAVIATFTVGTDEASTQWHVQRGPLPEHCAGVTLASEHLVVLKDAPTHAHALHEFGHAIGLSPTASEHLADEDAVMFHTAKNETITPADIRECVRVGACAPETLDPMERAAADWNAHTTPERQIRFVR